MPILASTDALPATIGVEIEITGASSIVSVENSVKSLGWSFVRDGSCGYEAVSPVLKTIADLEQIDRICRMLKMHGANVSTACGLHIHVGMQGVNDLAAKYRLFRFCSRYENVFFSLAPVSRQDNRYTRKLSDNVSVGMRGGKGWKSWKAEGCNHYHWDRYYWLNGTNMSAEASTKPTVEFRLMESVIDSEYIKGWISTLLCVVDSTIKGKRKVDWASDGATIDTFLNDAAITGAKRLDNIADSAYEFVNKHRTTND